MNSSLENTNMVYGLAHYYSVGLSSLPERLVHPGVDDWIPARGSHADYVGHQIEEEKVFDFHIR